MAIMVLLKLFPLSCKTHIPSVAGIKEMLILKSETDFSRDKWPLFVCVCVPPSGAQYYLPPHWDQIREMTFFRFYLTSSALPGHNHNLTVPKQFTISNNLKKHSQLSWLIQHFLDVQCPSNHLKGQTHTLPFLYIMPMVRNTGELKHNDTISH